MMVLMPWSLSVFFQVKSYISVAAQDIEWQELVRSIRGNDRFARQRREVLHDEIAGRIATGNAVQHQHTMRTRLCKQPLDARDGRDATRTALGIARIPDETHDQEGG